MKLKGTKEDIELAAKIQACNVDIVERMAVAIQNGEIWPEKKGDKEGNEVRKRYCAEALEGLNYLRQELNNPEASFYLKGKSHPILDLELTLAKAKEDDKGAKDTKGYKPFYPDVETYADRIRTAFAIMVHGKEYSYYRMVPDYSFTIEK